MHLLPKEFLPIILAFATLFPKPVWESILVLLVGAILQMLTQVRRWLPQRAIILVADSSFAALELLESLRQLPNAVHVVSRLRLDAALYDPAPERLPKPIGHRL